MEQFINQPALLWAVQNLSQPVEVKLKQHKVLLGICFGFLALIFLIIPIVIFFGALGSLVMKGWNTNDAQAVAGSFIFMAAIGALAFGIGLLIRAPRRKMVKHISSDGIVTRGGTRYGWADLHYLDYQKLSTPINVSSVNQLAASATRAAILSGVEKVTVEMVFGSGKAIVPPLITNQAEVLSLLNTIPAQRQQNGAVQAP